jgi:hypothetical protein
MGRGELGGNDIVFGGGEPSGDDVVSGGDSEVPGLVVSPRKTRSGRVRKEVGIASHKSRG